MPSNFAVGDTVWLDGIECVVIAKDITIQGSTLKNIAIDKNHDLGWYIDFQGNIFYDFVSDGMFFQNPSTLRNVHCRYIWCFGGQGSLMGNTSKEVGSGFQNTLNYLSNKANIYAEISKEGDAVTFSGGNVASLFKGLTLFRGLKGSNWFLPSCKELMILNQDELYKRLSFDQSLYDQDHKEKWLAFGGSSPSGFYGTSSEYDSERYYRFPLTGPYIDSYGSSIDEDGINYALKSGSMYARLCRLF